MNYELSIGISFVASIGALVYAYRAYSLAKKSFYIINNRNTRTVTVDMQDGKVTVIKEYKNENLPTDITIITKDD